MKQNLVSIWAFISVWTAVFFASGWVVAGDRAGDDLFILHERLIASHIPEECNALEQSVRMYMETILEDGSWPDVDYANADRSRWRTVEHVNRIASMAFAYHASECVLCQDKELLKKNTLCSRLLA